MIKQRGFTLIEMMLALAIFAVLSLAGYQLLQGMMRSSELTRQHVTRLEEIQRLFSLLDRDLSQAMIPAQNARLVAQQPAFTSSSTQIQLIRRNATLPGAEGHSSTLQAVRWRLDGSTLVRELPDKPGGSIRFAAINSLTLRYWSDGRWSSSWPAAFTLPQAIEIAINTADYGAISRIVMLSGVE